MSRIVLGELLNDIRNRLGNNVYSIERGTHYVRTGPFTIQNPNTARQQTVRTVFKDASQRWLSVLTDNQRALWDEYAQVIGSAKDSDKSQGCGGVIHVNRKNMRGFGAYVMTQTVRRSAGFGGWTDDAPLSIAKSHTPRNLNLTFSGAPNNELTVTWVDPHGMSPQCKIRVWARSWQWAHAQIVGIVAKAVQTFTWDKMRGDDGGELVLQSGGYDVQLDCVRPQGIKSAGSQIVRKVIAV